MMSEAMAMYLMVLLNCSDLSEGATCTRTPCSVTKTYDDTGSVTINARAVEIVIPEDITLVVE